MFSFNTVTDTASGVRDESQDVRAYPKKMFHIPGLLVQQKTTQNLRNNECHCSIVAGGLTLKVFLPKAFLLSTNLISHEGANHPRSM